jgi:hypothetical protein
MRASGPRPKGVSKKFKWIVGGGPPPNWPDWEDWVKRLGAAAYDEWVADSEAAQSWTPTKSRDEFSEAYVLEVRHFLSAGNDAASIKVQRDISEAQFYDAMRRRDRLKRITVVGSVFVAVVLGGAAGYAADVEAHSAVPGSAAVGIGAAVCATVAAAFASRPKRSRTLAALATTSDILKGIQREMRSTLKEVVNSLVRVVNPSLRAPPFRQGLLTETIATAFDHIHHGLGPRSHEVTLSLSGADRAAIARAADDLVREAEDQGLEAEDRQVATGVEMQERLTRHAYLL